MCNLIHIRDFLGQKAELKGMSKFNQETFIEGQEEGFMDDSDDLELAMDDNEDIIIPNRNVCERTFEEDLSFTDGDFYFCDECEKAMAV